MDETELAALLCLSYTHANQRPKLAEQLLETRSAAAVVFSEPWTSRPHNLGEVARVRFAMRTSQLVAVPVWEWPAHLLRMQPLAPVLFVRGNAELLQSNAIAVVGARDAHPSAERWAYEIAAEHARRGVLVVSGGARGIDTAAHRGALDGGGRTLAYLGVSADKVYPSHNRSLFQRILQNGGALISEYLPLETTFAHGHAMRNRFIAAHASRLFVAEADNESGSLGTADFARKFGVPVYISPPTIGVRRSGLDGLMERGQAEVAAFAELAT